MLRIRLRRIGKKGRPSYRMVVAEQQAPRDGAFLETLGSYDPHVDPPVMTLNEDRARDWIGKGAQPSEAAEKILRRAGVITAPAAPRPQRPSKADAAASAKATDEAQARKDAEAKAATEAEAVTEAEAATEADASTEAEAAPKAKAAPKGKDAADTETAAVEEPPAEDTEAPAGDAEADEEQSES